MIAVEAAELRGSFTKQETAIGRLAEPRCDRLASEAGRRKGRLAAASAAFVRSDITFASCSATAARIWMVNRFACGKSWSIYKLAARQTWIGEVEAAPEAEAVEKAAAQFKQYAPKLMAVRRAGEARPS